MRDRPGSILGDLATEAVNPETAAIDSLNALGIVRLMNEQDARIAKAVRAELPSIARAVEGIATRLRAGGHLIYVGAGTSGRLGVLDAAECPPTFGTDPSLVQAVIAGGERALTHAIEELEDRPEEGRRALAAIGLTPRDAVVGIAASGRTPFVIGALEYARETGALTVAVTCNRGSTLASRAEIAIEPVVGPEVIAGSTRLKAGTAEKMVLNMLSTGAMVLLGKTYGNLMVDLRASNAKLRDRAVRIVAAVTGLPPEEAARQLADAGGDAKTAIVAVLAGVTPEEARRRLHAVEGRVREALS
ncbi:MAG TPA: N-acetylmuramic acid 6-phosphate etherase [Chloroflexota bacterium]|nr:N-acetylmuramic acid 6-phosphate etherase [Chloroflexota bacterium]